MKINDTSVVFRIGPNILVQDNPGFFYSMSSGPVPTVSRQRGFQLIKTNPILIVVNDENSVPSGYVRELRLLRYNLNVLRAPRLSTMTVIPIANMINDLTNCKIQSQF